MSPAGSDPSGAESPVRTGAEEAAPTAALPIARSRSARVRAAVLVAVHVAIAAHIAHWVSTGRTLTPLEPSEAMEFSKHSVVNAGLVFLLACIALTAVLGRWFCGWACHVVALQDGCRWLLGRFGIRPRPLRSRALLAVPVIAALYMFVWPLAYRLAVGDSLAVRGSVWTTDSFWATFPSWPVALVTLACAGFATVYFLGAKGFCTYACPYGALFGAVERLAPARIRVTSACGSCGHCTAVCSSNVQVSAEVRDYGMVVDPGCMKCLDCVSVCPNDALYFGVGRPAIAARPRASGQPHAGSRALAKNKWRRWRSLSVPEEFLIALAFVALLLTFRGLYGQVPFLLSLALAGIGSWGALVTWRLVRTRASDVRLAPWTLRAHSGRTRAGSVFLVCAGVAALATGHSAWVQYASWQSARLQPTDPARALTYARRAYGAGLLPDRGLEARLRSLLLTNGADEEYEQRLARALRSTPDDVALVIELISFQAGRGRTDEARRLVEEALERNPESVPLWFHRGLVANASGDPQGAVAAYEAALELDATHLPSRENLAGTLCGLGKFPEGIEHFERALAQREDLETRLLTVRAYLALGNSDSAREHAQRATVLAPERPETWAALAQAERLAGRPDRARDHERRAGTLRNQRSGSR